jgi:hypothetical protein
LILNREFFIANNLNIQSPAKLESEYKYFLQNVKKQSKYDTADHANERLIFMGMPPLIINENSGVSGFDGLSAPRIFVKRHGKEKVKEMLLAADHYREGSINGAVLRALYGITKFEKLYNSIFSEKPNFITGFSDEEIADIPMSNHKLSPVEQRLLCDYFLKTDRVLDDLIYRSQC